MFSGSMVAIVTPMTADGGLDWPAWDRLLDFHVREGTDGIVVAGTTGESPALALDEIEELTRICDRYLVMSQGRVTGELPATATKLDLLAAVSGRIEMTWISP